jgi:high-affinity iron transporter
MSLRQFFNVTNILLVLFAAGLLAHGVYEFNEAGIIPPMIEHGWDINFILDESQTFGLLLMALFGYNGNPSLAEILAYGAYFVVAWLLWNKFAPVPFLNSASLKKTRKQMF